MQFQNSFLGIKIQLSASLKNFVELKPLIYEEWDGTWYKTKTRTIDSFDEYIRHIIN